MKIIRFSSALVLGFCLLQATAADYVVPAQTVGNGQTLPVTKTGKVTTTESTTPGEVKVQVQTGGKAVFIGGTSVVLKPGFRADSGSLFRASRDLNLGDFSNLDDLDNDGLPDQWEILHWGNTTTVTGLMDSDGDGINNAAEYYAGTDPKFNEAAGTIDTGAVRLVIKTSTGKFLKVLTDTNWSITAAP